ncbi:MAG: hypothetical protein RLY97_2171 [Pseudomonadota bacterium]
MFMRLFMVAGAALALAACAVSRVGKAEVQAPLVAGFAGGAGQAEAVAACAACHPATMVTSKHYSEDKWAEVVDQMIAKGAKVNDANYEVIVGYLARNYGVGKAG